MQPIYMAASKIKFTETDEGFLVEGFLISNKLNANGWMVTREANKIDGHEWKGQPDIYFIKNGRPDHTTGDSYEASIEAQEPFRKGTMQKILGLDTGTRLSSISKIEDPDIAQRIKNKEIMWTSPAVFPRSLADVEIVPTGLNSHIHILHRYRPLHRAFVDEPAYGRGETQLGLTCEGNTKECLVKLEQLKAGIGDDDVNPLRTIPLKVSRCAETNNLIVELKAGEEADCVSRILSEKLGPGEEPTDQDLAIAFEECRKQKSSKANSSLKPESRYGNQMPDEEITRKEMDALKSQMNDISEDVKKALKAQTETEEEKEKARKAQEEKDKENGKGGREDTPDPRAKRGKHGQENETEKEKEARIAQEEDEEKKAQEEEEKKMTARIASELSVKIPLVEKYVAAKIAQKSLDEKASTELREKMLKASTDEIKEKLDDIESFVGITEQSTESKIGYMGSTDFVANADLENKSTEELLEEAELTD